MSEPMKIDQALDDIIKSVRTGGGGRGRRGSGRRGPVFETRRGPGGRTSAIRTGGSGGVMRTIAKPNRRSDGGMDVDGGEKWQHDRYQPDQRPVRKTVPGGRRGGEDSTGTKIIVANLEFSVTNGDIHDLFSGVGTIKQAMVKFDKNGKSTGQAEVVFSNKNDALEAIKKYNGVPLDNRPLKISLGTTHSIEAPLRSEAGTTGGSQGSRRTVIRSDRGRGGRRRGRGRGGRGGGGDRPMMTKEELDAQLENIAVGDTKTTDENGSGMVDT